VKAAVLGLPILLLAASIGLTACHAPATKSATGSADVHSYHGEGIIEHISPDRHLVTLHHQAIPGYMMEMTMDFPVRDDHLLDGLSTGDRVDFTLVVANDDAWVGSLHRTGHADPATVQRDALPALPAKLRPGDPMPDAELVAEDGRHIHLADFQGKVVVLTFFFTRCPLPTYCPLMNRDFAQTRALLRAQPGAAKNWEFISISFDPDYDNPQVLASYAKFYRGADADRWLFASASPTALAQLAAPLGLIVMRQAASISHNLRTVVIDPAGRLFRQFNDNTFTPHQLEDAVTAADR
jgi:protein SCO1/2